MQPNVPHPEEESRVQETHFAIHADEPTDTIPSDESFHSALLSNGKTLSDRSLSTDHARTNGVADNFTTHHDISAPAPTKVKASSRVLAPDLLRGLLMVLQAIDHCSVSQGAWRHGVALESEADGTVVKSWNGPVAWTARMFTHLCAPGFMFLLGMGVVYFGQSRNKLGWTTWQMVKHFTIRAFVLIALNELTFTLPFGRGRVAIINIILFALAVNYLITGLLWLAINASERLFSTLLATVMSEPSDHDETQPLLEDVENRSPKLDKARRAIATSWHIHNTAILVLAMVSIAWNHWLSPHQGRCPPTPPGYSGGTNPRSTRLGPWFDFWFLSLTTKLVVSPFPPLAWLSPALLGLLYGRVVLARQWRSNIINVSNLVTGIAFMILFILTRLVNFGNLSEDCLRMPEQLRSPNKNQYLVSFRSFFYITKYPPSFSYIAFTMSFNFLLLGGFGFLSEKNARRIPTLLTFGQSALFFYVLHLLLYFALGYLAKTWFGHDLGYTDPFDGKPAIGTSQHPAVMWVTWIIGLSILWPLCRWYGRYKSSKGPNSVWRFF